MAAEQACCVLKSRIAWQAPSKGRGKQKGPLPMTIAQLVVLGIFGGIGYAFTVKAEQSATLVQAAVDTLIRCGAWSACDSKCPQGLAQLM